MSNYKDNPVYKAYEEAIRFLESKGYEVKCRYNRFEKPTKKSDYEMNYNISVPWKDKAWLYLILKGKSQYASLELEPQYVKNVDTSGFYRIQERGDAALTHLKLFFTDFKKVKNAFSEIFGGFDPISPVGGELMFDKNKILYGPPGTGKTYNTVCYAVAICDNKSLEELNSTDYKVVKKRFDELKNEGRIEFTTFHQSYGYEEFIEGIKPIVENDGSGLQYEIKPGVFKQFCEHARFVGEDMSSGVNRIWNVRNRTGDKDIPFDLESYVYDNNVVLVENILDEKRQCNYLAKMDHGDIVVFGRDQHIDAVGIVDDYEPETLDKPPFYYQRKIKWLATGLNKSFDDIGKTKMSISNFAIAKSRLSMLDINNLINNHRDNTSPCVFIIDEINRGNISKIFGELITLIEDTKREGMDEEASATLPYSGEPFSVPKNVYLLGTMNTADRSIATIDTALRRRFAFEEMLPDSTILEGIDIGGINIENMLDSMNQKISVLFDREHTIGHAYFIPLRKNSDMKTLARVFKNNIIPLLQEYFYEDYEKIRLVLGDNKKQDESMQFIKAINNDYMSLFGEDVDLDVSYRYEINEAAFNNPEAYKYI